MSREALPSQSRTPRWIHVGFVVAGLASLAAVILMVVRALAMVGSNRGLETYWTHWLVEYNWVGFLVLAGAAMVALMVAAVLAWLSWRREQQQWRELESKYGGRQ